MLRGYRLVIIAAFGWLSLAASPAPNQAAKTEQAKPANEIGRSLETIATAQDKLAKASDAGEYQKPCGEGEYNNKSDLCAQWYAARAARDAADWTWWGLGIGLLSVAGLGITLLFNYLAWDEARKGRKDTDRAIREARRSNLISIVSEKRARREAKEAAEHTVAALAVAQANAEATLKSVAQAERAAKAAEESVVAIQTANALQLRPYVFLTSPNTLEAAKPLDFSPNGSIVFAVKNFGKTPAKNSYLQTAAEVVPVPIGNREISIPERQESLGAIGPGDHRPVTMFLKNLDEESFAMVRSGKFALLLKMKITYSVSETETDFHEITSVISKHYLDSGMGVSQISNEERERC